MSCIELTVVRLYILLVAYVHSIAAPVNYSVSCSPLKIVIDRITVTFSSCSTLPLSPAVRYIVDTNDVDPSVVPASGPKGRLLKG